jgi:hypothetical protein
MDLDSFIDLADQYVALGSSVQEQLKVVLEDGEPSDAQNPNALRLVAHFLERASRSDVEDANEVRADIEAYLA